MVEHRTVFGGLNSPQTFAPPVILQRTDQDFIGAMLDELSGANGLAVVTDAKRKKVAATRDQNHVLKLYQPVHRTFHIALLEIACDFQGQYPRLDPERIESAGLVVRRINHIGGREVAQAWMQEGRSFRGWVDMSVPGQTELDPDPALRPQALNAGHVEINRLLLLEQQSRLSQPRKLDRLVETVAPLYTAPPEVAAATGKTILYGLIPVTSTERSEAPAPALLFDKKDPDLRSHLSGHLKAGVNTPFSNLSGQAVTYAQAARPDPARVLFNAELSPFLLFLHQLAVEFNAFGQTPEAAKLFKELNNIQLPFITFKMIRNSNGVFVNTPVPTTRPAGEFLKEAKQVLLDGDGQRSGKSVKMPDSWPTVSATQEARLMDAITAAMSARLSEISPQEGRFEDLTRQYRVRAFVRVKREDGCPPQLIWTRPSEPFTIAAWYESNDMLPPVQIVLPSLGKDFVKKLKPNVAFAVPGDLANLLRGNDPKKMVTGEGQSASGGLQMDWICSFSIPIITFCAFIVLNIFLSLFDIIFQWMLYIKICIPFPKGKSPLPR